MKSGLFTLCLWLLATFVACVVSTLWLARLWTLMGAAIKFLNTH